MSVLEICKEMNWDYLTYRKQPQFFIDMVIARMIAKNRVKKFKKLKHGR